MHIEIDQVHSIVIHELEINEEGDISRLVTIETQDMRVIGFTLTAPTSYNLVPHYVKGNTNGQS